MVKKPPLLFLSHRIPYPPSKGDKIRSWNLLKRLADRFDVYLGTFIDDQDDWQYCDFLCQYCVDTCFVRRRPFIQKLLSTHSLLTGEALSVAYYRSAVMQKWVDRVVSESAITRAFIFCSPMAQFVLPTTKAGVLLENVVVDLVDVDSEKWRQYAEKSRLISRWIFTREGDRLLEFEVSAARFARSVRLVSEPETELFRQRAVEVKEKASSLPNGIDTEYFNPADAFKCPYPSEVSVLVFTGAMDYWPNVDAASWFAREVFPGLKSAHPELEFWVVGANPGAQVTSLAEISGVRVTGKVADVRPYLRHALAAVAPMRVARGVQNKVLEAMAMSIPVIASSEALTGVDANNGVGVYVGDSGDDYLAAVYSINELESSKMADAREWVKTRFCWDDSVDDLCSELLEFPAGLDSSQRYAHDAA